MARGVVLRGGVGITGKGSPRQRTPRPSAVTTRRPPSRGNTPPDRSGQNRYNVAVIRTVVCILFFALSLWAQKANWKIALEPPKAPKAEAPMPMEVRVTDAQGKPVTDAQVELVLTMIDMDHGETKSPAKAVKPGVYRGTATFLMGGAWNVEVRAKKGSQQAAQKFRLTVKD